MGDAHGRLSRWRLSSWQLRPVFETGYRQASRDHAHGRRDVEHATGRLDQATRDLADAQGWVDRHHHDIHRAPELDRQLADDLAARTETARHDPPQWALHSLGPRLDPHPAAAAAWDHAVAAVEQHRIINDIRDTRRPAGPEPHRLDPSHPGWRRATNALREAVREIEHAHTLDPSGVPRPALTPPLRPDLHLDQGLSISR